ncbi:MAG: DUF402 domain-containing protein [Gemmatimonadota bacterium]|nr:DUF402 domain-containing protein [Gemmatimonadota bacterium]
MPGRVRIHYHRPPDRLQIFDQGVVLRRADVVVTLAESIEFHPPMRVNGEIVLEEGSSVVWFTFPGAWHDIGLFHRADGTFSGVYANILTPARMDPDGTWHTTDLFLDVWLPPDGAVQLLDEDEFREAVTRGWIDAETSERAEEEARALLEEARNGTWPPPVVGEWPLSRCLGRTPTRR